MLNTPQTDNKQTEKQRDTQTETERVKQMK